MTSVGLLGLDVQIVPVVRYITNSARDFIYIYIFIHCKR